MKWLEHLIASLPKEHQKPPRDMVAPGEKVVGEVPIRLRSMFCLHQYLHLLAMQKDEEIKHKVSGYNMSVLDKVLRGEDKEDILVAEVAKARVMEETWEQLRYALSDLQDDQRLVKEMFWRAVRFELNIPREHIGVRSGWQVVIIDQNAQALEEIQQIIQHSGHRHSFDPDDNESERSH